MFVVERGNKKDVEREKKRGRGNSLETVRGGLLQAEVEKGECSAGGCRAGTESRSHQSGHLQEAMLPEAVNVD